jgi:hypothetical protein
MRYNNTEIKTTIIFGKELNQLRNNHIKSTGRQDYLQGNDNTWRKKQQHLVNNKKSWTHYKPQQHQSFRCLESPHPKKNNILMLEMGWPYVFLLYDTKRMPSGLNPEMRQECLNLTRFERERRELGAGGGGGGGEGRPIFD